jgi:hypothetical protein
MIQTLLKYQLPKGVRVYPNQFRELLAKQDLQLPEAFHRTPDGKTNTGLPGICFVGGVSWVGILANPNQDAIFNQMIGPATMAISRFLNTSVPVQIDQIKFGAQARLVPVNYRLREMALKRRYDTTRARPVEELVRERILKGMARIANQYGIDLPSDDALDVDVTIRYERGLRLEVPQKMTNEFLHLVDADVSMNVDLAGMWQVGNLTSRGYGRLIQEHPGIPANKQIIGVEHA